MVAVGMTGGHIIPGIAVAEELKILEPACDVVFAGAMRGRAAEMARRWGFRYIPVPATGWAGIGVFGKVLFLFSLARSLVRAFGAVRRERPCVIVGTGSYATLPFAISALILSIPLILLEQNVVPGRVTRLLSGFAAEVHVAFRESIDYLREPGRALVTGNPIRIGTGSRDRDVVLSQFDLLPDRKTVLVFGGSRGARSINRAFAGAVRTLARDRGLQFIVQTGEEDLKDVRNACADAGAKAFVAPFIHEMGDAYVCADLVVCRAGATTIAELTGFGLPSILIPYPYSAGGHQEKNALLLEDMGASRVVRDENLNGDVLADAVAELLGDPVGIGEMRARASELGRRDAARAVAGSVLRLVGESCSER